MQEIPEMQESWGLRELRSFFVNKLISQYERRECEKICEWVFSELAGTQKIDFALHPERRLNGEQLTKVNGALEELSRGRPVQYVLGATEFLGMRLTVDEHVLIPRPETEELVRWAQDDHRGRKKLKVLDIGTGSGCIALAMQKAFPDAKIFGGDVSPGAILAAEKNARDLSLPVTFFHFDVFSPDTPLGRQVFDVILSNPPYVTESEKLYMKPHVLGHEPHQALFVPNTDPLKYYKAIAAFALKQLDDTGTVYVEINERFGKEVVRLFEQSGFSLVTLRKDLNGRDRMVRAVR